MLMDRYHEAIDELFAKVRETQRENIIKAGELIADAIQNGGKVWLDTICHYIEFDSINRGGGPAFYQKLSQFDKCKPGDVIITSSVSGRTESVVNLAYEAVEKGMTVIAFTSMAYATEVEPVHFSGKKLYEIATHTLDNCAPKAEAMIDVPGIEAKFAAASGIASDYIMWSITSCVVDTLMARGITPGILKSANFPGGMEYNIEVVNKNYEKYGW